MIFTVPRPEKMVCAITCCIMEEQQWNSKTCGMDILNTIKNKNLLNEFYL